MKNKRSIKHRGEILQNRVDKSGISVTLVVKKAGYSRTSYYNHILDAELPFTILNEYGKALKHDFSIDFPEMKNEFLAEEDEANAYTRPATLEQAIRERDKWRDKYYTLMEKYNQLLEEKMKK